MSRVIWYATLTIDCLGNTDQGLNAWYEIRDWCWKTFQLPVTDVTVVNDGDGSWSYKSRWGLTRTTWDSLIVDMKFAHEWQRSAFVLNWAEWPIELSVGYYDE